MLRCVNHQEKLIFLKNKISVLEAELQVKIKNIESQAAKIMFLKKKSFAAIFQSVNVIFLACKS